MLHVIKASEKEGVLTAIRGFRPISSQIRPLLAARSLMRSVLSLQPQLGASDIGDIQLDPQSRDDIPAVLKGLQCVYCDPACRGRAVRPARAACPARHRPQRRPSGHGPVASARHGPPQAGRQLRFRPADRAGQQPHPGAPDAGPGRGRVRLRPVPPADRDRQRRAPVGGPAGAGEPGARGGRARGGGTRAGHEPGRALR